MLRKQMAVRKMRSFGHFIRLWGFDKELIQGSVKGKRRRGRLVTSWMNDIKKWSGQGMAAAARSTADRDLWPELVMTTAV